MEIELKDLKYYLDDMAQRQLPFACAKALTDTSAKIGQDLSQMAAHQFYTTTPFSRTHKTARLGASPATVKASSFVTLPADKHHGLDRMQATLLNQHWGISEQIDSTTSERLPNKNKYLWVPLQKRRKNFTPGKARTQKGVFVIKSKGHYFMMQRKGKSRELTPLFMSRRSQTIRPVFNFKKITEQRAPRYMDIFFNREMEAALRTAKW